MLVKTKYFDEMEIDERKIITFGSGLPGFLEERQFIVLDIPGNNLLQILQSIHTPSLAFFVTNPHYFYDDYEFSLDEHIVESLEIIDEKDVVILSIMTMKEPFHLSTINLQAPLIINSNKKYGKQFILNDEKYSMKATISFPTTEKRGE
ncbi:flagellar assembly protein FliW [Pseudogracilibacillus auburnensis]|uniref:Flagellar assembly factor FliW n=1 Tax=Pseudogracilibacillus auburnensis TaxID=1494959 RepID=A0A2V3WBK0_9BACI|nr:flagellar assembly protein FliW [Pseudogracilibacillus auburnensis]MBO1001544.1 flagellar assembly protein FliW [Pseudogracilibacillus auburnensis]PXW89535.1 flagellar assembly factor FliW [Pseudogracilibacillus auburnensis]